MYIDMIFMILVIMLLTESRKQHDSLQIHGKHMPSSGRKNAASTVALTVVLPAQGAQLQ